MTPVRSAVPGIVWPGLPSASGAVLLALLDQLEHTQWWPEQALRAAQFRQLEALLAHAFEHVPHYAATLRAAGYTPGCGIDGDLFQRLPLLRREDLQTAGETLLSRDPPSAHGRVGWGASSGSTGTPIRYARCEAELAYLNAFGLRDHLWRGRDLGAKYAVIRTTVERGAGAGWGAPADSAFRTGSHATLNIREPVHVQAQWLAQESPAYLLSHGTNLAALARHCLESGLRIESLREVCSFGEMMPPELPALARAAWGAAASDLYSAEEAGPIALQCPQRPHFHVQAERMIVEVLRPDGSPCAPGEIGRVVLTVLHNFAMPLIRYQIGDYAEPGAPCPCGRGLPVLARIAGRSRNMLRLPDGAQRWPSFPAELWLDIAPFRQFRLVQRGATLLVARFTIDRALTQDEERRLVAALQEKLGFAFEIRLERSAAIERSANAKYEDFVCEISG